MTEPDPQTRIAKALEGIQFGLLVTNVWLACIAGILFAK